MIKCFNTHYIIGIKKDIKLVFIMVIAYFASFTGWVLCLYSFYPFYLFMISGLIFILVIWYYLISFFTEPGIIPRRYHTFITLSEGNHEQNAINISNSNNNNKANQNAIIKTTSNENSLCVENTSNNTSINNNTSTIINNSLIINDDNKKIVINIFPEITQIQDQQGIML